MNLRPWSALITSRGEVNHDLQYGSVRRRQSPSCQSQAEQLSTATPAISESPSWPVAPYKNFLLMG